MKLKKSKYTITILKDYIETSHSMIGSDIELKATASIDSAITASPILLTIDGSTILSSGNPIIIAEEGLQRISLLDPLSLNMSAYRQAYKLLIDNNKNFAIIISSHTGTPTCMYLGKNLSKVDISNGLPKTSYFNIDGKDLYIHHANYEFLPVTLLK